MSKPNKFRQVNRENMEAQPNGVENKTTSPEPAKIAPIVAENGDKSKGPSYLSKIATYIKSAASTAWSWCQTAAQWTWSGIKTIPSYCVIRWDSENGEDEIDEIAPTKSVAKIEPVKVAATKTNETVEPPVADDKSGFSFASFMPQFSVKALCTSWLKFLPQRTQKTHEEEQYDEDELAPSRWWGIGIKAAAGIVAALVLVGGYFVITPLFNAPTDDTLADVEILAPTDQAELLAQESQSTTPAPVAPAVAARAPVPEPVVVTPSVAASAIAPVPQQPQPEVFAAIPATPSPTQGSLFGNDPFPAAPVAPAVAEATPPIASDSIVTTKVPPPLVALQPLVPVEHVPSVNSQPPLQPLVALNASSFPSVVVADVPAAAPASVATPFANNFGNAASPAFSQQAPTPPPVAVFPQTAAERTLMEPEPTREIVPTIQHIGRIETVPPPVVAETPEYQKPEYRLNSEYIMNSETAPAIPRDAPTTNAPPVVVVPTVAPVAESSPQVLSTATPPIDRQLWEQVELLRNVETEPTQLQFDTSTATTEPALRFTPRNAATLQPAPPANEGNLLAQGAADSLQDLLPTANDLFPSPNSNAIAIALPALANAPQPVWAELAPAYRDVSSNQSSQPSNEGGLTFRNRIDSQISRSPSTTETYTIQPGDTYMTISDRFYGTSLLYTALAQHNQRLGIGWRPAEGVVIEIPTAEFLRMHYGEATNRQERRLETQRAAVRYIVQEGDTVFRLATDRLRDSTRWREIYAMNADRLQDVRDLQPGMEILLPVVETAQRN